MFNLIIIKWNYRFYSIYKIGLCFMDEFSVH